MNTDPRNAIWDEAYNLQYRVSYAAMLKTALLAIISKQLNVAETLKMHATSVAALGNLDTEIGSMILRMKIHTDFGIEEFEKDLLALRNKFGAESNMFVHDLLLTQALRTKTQTALNRTLGSS